MQPILIYITVPSSQEADAIATHLFDKQLIVCANIFPITSMYWSRGAIENDDELVLVLKTFELYYSAIEKEVEQIHSYEVPCILKIPVQANNAYIKFMQDAIKQE